MNRKSAENTEFVQLLTKHQRTLYLYIVALVPNLADVDDVLQATNMVLWSKADEFKARSDFGAWARRVAHFQVLAFWKRERGRRLVFDNDLIDLLAVEWEEEAEGLESRRQALNGCLKKLCDTDRELLARRYGSGSTVAQIAEQVARPVKSVYRSLERTRMTLLECIRRSLATEDSL
ncbi:MAG: sigma-70 family RNA polymerase sigma factor [Pirellulaceae bacterium]|nr:sigma-70 family RNA polymerase sigma factor [Pirellulaceae bacterium]